MLADFIPAKKGQRGHWDFYICARKKNSRDLKCDSKRIGARVLETSIIQALIEQVLTRDNLRPIADTIAQQLLETNQSASTRLSVVQTELQQVERQIDNLLSAIEDMGLSPSLKEKLTKREAECERLKSHAAQLQALVVQVSDIPRVSNDILDEWIDSMRQSLQSENTEIARRALRHFVSKVILKDAEGTIFYTFPVDVAETGCRSLGKGEVDLRGFEPLTSTVRL